MKKLTYLATLAGSMLIATSCVDLNQEPQSFIIYLHNKSGVIGKCGYRFIQ